MAYKTITYGKTPPESLPASSEDLAAASEILSDPMQRAGMFRDVHGCTGTYRDATGRSGSHRDATGGTKMHRDASRCCGALVQEMERL